MSKEVLEAMGKPATMYEAFRKVHDPNIKLGKKQFLVPYLISAHPGSTIKDAGACTYLKSITIPTGSDFYPTPGTLSTCMYHTGIDPLTGRNIYVPKSHKERSMQRALLQFSRPENSALVIEALKLAGREDLIGWGSKYLVRPAVSGNYAKGKVR